MRAWRGGRTDLAIVGALAAAAASKHHQRYVAWGNHGLVVLRSLSYGQAAQGAYVNVSGAVPATATPGCRIESASCEPQIGGDAA